MNTWPHALCDFVPEANSTAGPEKPSTSTGSRSPGMNGPKISGR